MDYSWEALKTFGEENGHRLKDLVALAAQNDPFAVDTPAQREKAEWFAEVWDMLGYSSGVHVRRAHYQAMSVGIIKPDGTPYQNTPKDWGLMKLASKYARYLGLVPMDGFVDMKNPEPVENTNYAWMEDPTPSIATYFEDSFPDYELPDLPDLPDLPASLPDLPYYEIYGYTDTQQSYHLEIWAEKTGMNSEIIPLGQRYKFNLITGAGDLSISAVRDFMERVKISGLPGRILYISDLDPQGFAMPTGISRKIEWFYRTQGYGDLNIIVQPLVLTAEQAVFYNLPVAPSTQGKPQTELDALEALHPGEFRRIVTEAVLRYHDPELQNRAWAVKRELRQAMSQEQKDRIKPFQDRLDSVEIDYSKVLNDFNETQDDFARLTSGFQDELDSYKDDLQDIVDETITIYREIQDDLEKTEIDPEPEFPLPNAYLPDESGDLLFDSGREFMEQMEFYNERKAQARAIFDKKRLNGQNGGGGKDV